MVREDPTVISYSASPGEQPLRSQAAGGWKSLLTKASSVADHCPTLSSFPISPSVVSEARAGKAQAQARCVCALSIQH
jgi:hypothetical protein